MLDWLSLPPSHRHNHGARGTSGPTTSKSCVSVSDIHQHNASTTDDCNNASTGDMVDKVEKGPSCLSLKTVRFCWLSPTSRLTTAEYACRARKPPARGVFSAPFFNHGSMPNTKSFRARRLFYTLALHLWCTTYTNIHKCREHCCVFVISAFTNLHDRRARKHTNVGFRGRRLFYTTLSMETHRNVFPAPRRGRFSYPAPSPHLDVWREGLPSPSCLLNHVK